MNFDNLFRYHYRPLCLYAIHYIHDVDVAEDIVQECFSVLWEKMEQEGGEIVNIRSYLYTMVRNRSLDWLKVVCSILVFLHPIWKTGYPRKM